MQTQPVAGQLQGEFQGSLTRARTRVIPSWFADYQAKVQGAAQNTQAAYNQAGNQWAGYLNTANTQDAAARDKVNQSAQADATLRGANVSTLAADQAQNASARRTDLGAVGGGTIANQGANAYAYLQDKSRIGARSQVDQQLQEAKRRTGISNDQRALAQKKGDIKNQARQDLRKSERDYLIQQQAFSTPSASSRLSAQTSTQQRRPRSNLVLTLLFLLPLRSLTLSESVSARSRPSSLASSIRG